jgi:hypothetical protein
MFYAKNLPTWERLVRLIAAAVMVLCAAYFWGTPVGYAWGIGGVIMALTSAVGFCPMCALAGRRIAAKSKALQSHAE